MQRCYLFQGDCDSFETEEPQVCSQIDFVEYQDM